MTADRTFYRALGYHAALTSYGYTQERRATMTITELRAHAEDLAAVIEAFATEPPVTAAAAPKTESAEHQLTS